ncbi:MAG TPA: aspartyl/asparaginyl beta-hydroxylase domain-containing protein [Pusillimonas sp.]|uniref:aspartyl/asparaginyl beta-hydroxylase domain-containing protein n=1 Tax=unclassified Pusillimonas TaxID=2640016 RepID=UPI0026160948|nr:MULTISPECIES: aspartyl/asparaginyl beta-hydroxylase domain-containing protein [unclassified Pusillimonas]HLU20536.1 aspartyl/asparaginyl beta-hydroxylase domain-containing protein [Pusillimonas sp.]
MIKAVIIVLWLGSITYIYFRGKVRLSFFRTVFNHTSLLAPVNAFMYVFSAVPARPYISNTGIKGLAALDENWEVIRQEAAALAREERIRAAANNDDAGFNSFFKTGWKRFYLKWYNAEHPSAAELCPKTVALLRNIPEVKAALFAVLPPGAKLNPHRDPYAGSLRYHLGLDTPNDAGCFIEVDGQRYSWRDGESVVFDETYIHWAQNTTDQTRTILFCDLERPLKYRWAARFNRWFSRVVMTAAASPNQEGDQVGLVSRLFRISWVVGQYRRRLKRWNKTVYHVVRAALIIGVIALIIFI